MVRLREAGIHYEVSLIYGLPGQTLASFAGGAVWNGMGNEALACLLMVGCCFWRIDWLPGIQG